MFGIFVKIMFDRFYNFGSGVEGEKARKREKKKVERFMKSEEEDDQDDADNEYIPGILYIYNFYFF